MCFAIALMGLIVTVFFYQKKHRFLLAGMFIVGYLGLSFLANYKGGDISSNEGLNRIVEGLSSFTQSKKSGYDDESTMRLSQMVLEDYMSKTPIIGLGLSSQGDDFDVISGNENIDIGMSDYTGCNQVTFGMDHGANLYHDFREAVVKSLNWELIGQLINGDYGETPGSGILPRACAGYDSSLWMMYQDADEAAALLDAAGFKDVNGDGFREMPDGTALVYKITSQLSPSRNDLYTRIGQVMVDSLNKVGINAYFDTDALASEEINDKMVADNDYDMFIGYTTSGVAAYRTCFWYFLNRSIVGSGAMNWGGSYNDPELNNAYIQLMNAASNDEYIDAVHKLQKLASEDLFAYALCWEKCFFPYRTDKYQGFVNMDAVGVVHAETFYQLTNK